MAVQVKLTVARGAKALKDAALSAGTPIAGSDAIEVNIDRTVMTKQEALLLLDRVRQRIFASPWPLA